MAPASEAGVNGGSFSPLDVNALPSLHDLGFTGGRNDFRAFCARAFAPDAPRFLRSDEGQLVVFRQEDLRAFGAMAVVGNVPPAILFPTLSEAWTGQSSPGAAFAGVIANQAFTANPPIHDSPPSAAAAISALGGTWRACWRG